MEVTFQDRPIESVGEIGGNVFELPKLVVGFFHK